MICALDFGRSKELFPPEDREARNAFIGEMRTVLAAVCVHALEPVLIILDEFQRFEDLLRPDNPAGDWRVISLLGKMRVCCCSQRRRTRCTLSIKDFVETLRFLQDDEARTEAIKELLADCGRAAARGWGRTG